MLKNLSRLESIVADKVFHFVCDMDSSLPMVKEALFQFQKYVGKIEDDVRAQEQAKIDAEKASQPNVNEVSKEEPKPMVNDADKQ